MRFALLLFSCLLFSLPAMAASSAYPVKPYALTAEDKATLARLSAYLESIHTIEADFIQAAPSGEIATGKFTLKRPGKLRMEYDPPTPVLMVASGGDIVYYDKQLQQVTHISLESTLVGFLASENIRFDDPAVVVTQWERGQNSLRVSLIQAKRPKDGLLTLEFSDNPLALRNMVVTNSAGEQTTVALNKARYGVVLDDDLFIFKDPRPDNKRGGRMH